ncbi:MAG TPA: DEAD/DEAH box helicase, partial [Chitinophagaceae bacterium]|nr:DEAD/DEAH box helicase [Chitinophagaceae bacterium]
MSLPHLVKYVYNNGTDEVIRRGKRIHAFGYVELVEFDELPGSVVFRVKDDSYATYYKVYISKFKDPKTIAVRCSCPYNLGEICRHEAAALLQLQEMLDKNLLGDKDLIYDQRHTVIKMKQIELKLIKVLTSQQSLATAENYLRSHKANIAAAKDECVQAELELDNKTYRVLIQKNEERNFDASCNCNSEIKHPLCVHKTIVLLQLLNSYGANYFDSIRNWDKEKNKLLALYGYSLSDDIEGKFEFSYKEGKPFLRVLDTTIKRVAQPAAVQVKPRPFEEVPQMAAETEVITEAPAKPQLQLGVVFSYNVHQYPYIQADAIQGESNDEITAFTGKVEKLDMAKFINTEVFDEDDKGLLQQLRKLMPGEVSRYLNRNSPFSGIWENIIQQHDDTLPEETRYLIVEYLHPKYKKLFESVQENALTFFLPANKQFVTSALKKTYCSPEFIAPEFAVNQKQNGYEISCSISTPDGYFSIADNEISSAFLFKMQDSFYLWQRPEDVLLAEKFLPSGKMFIENENWARELQQFILPLSKEYNVQFGNISKEEIKDIKPEFKILLREKGDYLLLQPVFTYQGYDIRPQDKEKIILPHGDKLLVIHRNVSAEHTFIDKINNLHTGFVKPDNSFTLALKGAEVLKNNWFFLFIDAVKEMNVPVYGFDSLQKFRFNTAKPVTKIFISSNTDWFDAKIDIHFGNQKVTVADVKKALASKQQHVQLQDGTLGILPEDWLRKYSLLFRVGEGKATSIKLSKYHFSVIEELYNKRDEEELFFQLEQKYDKLRYHHEIKEIEPPQHLEHILRPYQTAGFQWLNYLSEVKWGGILADDMGLGKTVQALAFLHYLRHGNGRLKALVVCPTTLMYNWENEIKKFT